jgi:hypothetical protein
LRPASAINKWIADYEYACEEAKQNEWMQEYWEMTDAEREAYEKEFRKWLNGESD